jgi:hypothetical protein
MPTATCIPRAQKLVTKLSAATAPELIQIAPGRWMPNGGGKLPDVCLATFRRMNDGTVELLPITERLFALTEPLVKRLGFTDGDASTLQRLATAGFIEIVRVSPHRRLINLDSYYNHLRRVAEDPEFWDNEDNRAAYREAL